MGHDPRDNNVMHRWCTGDVLEHWAWDMATRKILSDRQKRRLRANIAKQIVEYDVKAFRKRSGHTESDTPANNIHHDNVEETLCDADIDIETPGSDNQSSDISECMSNASSGEDSLSSSTSDQMDQLQDYTSEISDEFSDFDGYSSTNSEHEEAEQGVRRLLYPGAQLSSHEFSVALMSVYQKHNLTYSALEDILKLFQCVLSSPNALPTSQHMVLKEFVTYDAETIIHRCCDTCCQLLPDGSCTRRECRASGAKEATFVEVAIDAQLKERFMGKSLYQNIGV